jgi:hypothetical protein
MNNHIEFHLALFKEKNELLLYVRPSKVIFATPIIQSF